MAAAFLADAGIKLAAVTLCGGHSRPRTHHEAPRPDGRPSPIGWNIIAALSARVKEQKNITVVTGARLLALLQDTEAEAETVGDGTTATTTNNRGARAVTGVRVQLPAGCPILTDGNEPAANVITTAGASADASTSTSSAAAPAAAPAAAVVAELRYDAVVLATGGFGHDAALLAEFAPAGVAGMPTTNGEWAAGEGVKAARAAGADLVGMRHVQVRLTPAPACHEDSLWKASSCIICPKLQLHPTAFIDPAHPTENHKFLGGFCMSLLCASTQALMWFPTQAPRHCEGWAAYC